MVSEPRDLSTAILSIDGRKLLAVVYADMAGYSRLIGLDDADTFVRLRELRHDLIDPALVRHGGTLVQTAGDSLLVTFESIISAVRFAVDVQRGVPDFDGDYPPDRRVRFRMGVNVGDAIPDGMNLHGEGVNIAARLQTVCPPGAICISRVVRDQVGNRLGLGFKELGAINLKNIARPIEAFLIELEPAAMPLLAALDRRPGRTAVLAGAVVVCVAAVIGLAGWAGLHFLSDTLPSHSVTAQADNSDLPALSIAVLPFENLSGDPDQAYLADGISEDLTTDLSHLDNAFVIARESAFSYRGKSIDVRDVGRQLGVRYVLEGSVRKINTSVRITAQLIATNTGAHLWAEHFDKPVAELGEGQDDIVARIASALDVRMVNVESARLARLQSGTPAAFDLILRARSVLLEPVGRDRDFIALGLLLQALRLDPNSVPAMTGVASMFIGRFSGLYPGNSFDHSDLIKRATELITTAEQRTPNAPDVLVAKFLLLQGEQRNAEAIEIYKHLLDVDSSATGTILQIGLWRWTSYPAAIPLLRKTIQLNPRSAGVRPLCTSLARTLLLADRAEEARDLLTQTLALPPFPSLTPPPSGEDVPAERWRNVARMFLAIADVRTGRIDEAQRVVKQAMEVPSMREASVSWFMRGLREYDDADLVARERRFAGDLHLAGMRDHLDEDADSGIPSTDGLRDVAHLNDPTPMSIPGGRMVRTPEVVDMLAKAKPLILTTSINVPTIPGAIYVNLPGSGNLQDAWQSNLKRLMRELAQGDLHRPIIVFSVNIYRWIGRNLALRLIALGYTDVAWYRGGWEAWEASGQPRGPLERRDL
jgi:adenylate cyclase